MITLTELQKQKETIEEIRQMLLDYDFKGWKREHIEYKVDQFKAMKEDYNKYHPCSNCDMFWHESERRKPNKPMTCSKECTEALRKLNKRINKPNSLGKTDF